MLKFKKTLMAIQNKGRVLFRKQRELDVLLLTHLGLENSDTVFSWSKGVDENLRKKNEIKNMIFLGLVHKGSKIRCLNEFCQILPKTDLPKFGSIRMYFLF